MNKLWQLSNRLRFEFLALTIVILAFAIADIRAEIPINDDWAYYKPVEWLHSFSILRFTNWQYMTLVSQTFLAWPWTLVFGFSYFSLRVLTVVISFIGLLFLYRLVLLVTCDRLLSAALSLSFYFNPIVIANSASFMTDIYFWSYSLGAIFLLYSSLLKPDCRREAAGWTLALLALMVRQLAIAIPIGLIVALALRGDRWSKVFSNAVLPLLVMLALLALYRTIIIHTIGLPSEFDTPSHMLSAVIGDMLGGHIGALRPTIRGLGSGALYLGLFAIPLALPLFASSLSGRWKIAALGLTMAGFLIAILLQTPVPSMGNVIMTWGLGPRLLSSMVPEPVGLLWWTVTLLSCFSMATLLAALAAILTLNSMQGLWIRVRQEWLIFGLLVTAMVAYAPLIMIYGPWIDRHMLFSASLILVVTGSIGARLANSSIGGAVALLAAIMGLCSVVMLHDSFSWRRAVVASIEALEHSGVEPRDINGGFEHVNLIALPDDPRQPIPPVVQKGTATRCAVGELVPAGQIVISTVQVKTWLPIGARSISAYCRPERGAT